MTIRVRIAPSPTGLAHLGTIYTALFNYAFARQNQGQFILRIEDTDVKRHVPEAEQVIYDAFAWLGLDYDEGPDKSGPFQPYRQSERLKLYQDYAHQLVHQKLAYEDEGAIRFRVPAGQTGWQDLIRGEVKFANDQIKDFVVLKSDGYPTYNFAVVVDDWLMQITHVVRAEDHVSNTPRQLLIYQALQAPVPQFAHLPLLRNPDHSKISKRKNPVAIAWYRQQGYLPDALLNFLCLLGWSHPQSQEVFPLDEFVKHFSFARVSTSAPVFDLTKLDWLNGVYIRQKTDRELAQLLKPFAPPKMSETLIEQTVPLIKERINKLSDYAAMVDFLVKEPKIDQALLLKKSRQDEKTVAEQRALAVEKLAAVEDWQAEKLERVCRDLAAEKNYHAGKFFMALRIVITGKAVTPPLFASLALLGKTKTLARLQKK